MGTTIISTLQRGSTNISPFPVILESDARLSYMTVATVADRDALPDWQRTAGMRVHIVATNTDYRLGIEVTRATQVWTEVSSSSLYQILSEKGDPGGYVGLEPDGFIDPAFIKQIYSTTAHVVNTIAERNALITKTGDIIVVTGTSQTFVKLTNNGPTNVDADFAELTVPSAVTSVNGKIGTVTIDFASVMGQPGSSTTFNSVVASSPAVSGNTGQIATNTAAIAAIVSQLGLVTTTSIALYVAGSVYNDGDVVVYGPEGSRDLYRVIETKGPISGILPTNKTIWEQIGAYYSRDEIDALLADIKNTPFDWERPLKELLKPGDIPGGNKLPVGIESVFYGPRYVVLTSDTEGTPVEIGLSSISHLTGLLDPKETIAIDLVQLRDIDLDTVVGVVYNPLPAISVLAVPTNPFIAVAGTPYTFQFEADVRDSVGDAVRRVISDIVTVNGVYPYLYGTSDLELDLATYYPELTTIVENKGNKKRLFSGANTYIYYLIPQAYGAAISIKDQHDDEVLGVLFDTSPTTVVVNSAGLDADWSANYLLYKSKVKVDVNNTYTFYHTLESDKIYLSDFLENNTSLHFTQSDKDRISGGGGKAGHGLKYRDVPPIADTIFLQRQYLVFKGEGVTMTDSPTGDETVIEITDIINGDDYLDKATYDPGTIGGNVFAMDNMLTGVTNKLFTAPEKTKLGNLTDNFKGGHNDSAALIAAHPVGVAGNYAQVLTPVPSIWIWDDTLPIPAWRDTGAASTGDMLISLYDTVGQPKYVFAMQNMIEEANNVPTPSGLEAKIFTQAERVKLTAIDTDLLATKVELKAANQAIIIKDITQVGHPFVLFDPVYYDTADAAFKKAQADTEIALCQGIISKIDGDKFDVAQGGRIVATAHTKGAPGIKYYLDPENLGALILTEPVLTDQYVQLVIEVIDVNTLFVWALLSPVIFNQSQMYK